MDHLVLVYISLAIGVCLGVLLMAIIAASHPDERPESRLVQPHAERPSWSEVGEPSGAGVGMSRRGWSVARVVEPTHAISGAKERDFA